MESRAKLFGHAIHPILIVFPLGLLATGVIFDAIYLLQGNPSGGLLDLLHKSEPEAVATG